MFNQLQKNKGKKVAAKMLEGKPEDICNTEKSYTGKYLITKLKHQFDTLSKKHTITLSAAKDSFSDDIPSGNNIPEVVMEDTNTINY